MCDVTFVLRKVWNSAKVALLRCLVSYRDHLAVSLPGNCWFTEETDLHNSPSGYEPIYEPTLTAEESDISDWAEEDEDMAVDTNHDQSNDVEHISAVVQVKDAEIPEAEAWIRDLEARMQFYNSQVGFEESNMPELQSVMDSIGEPSPAEEQGQGKGNARMLDQDHAQGLATASEDEVEGFKLTSEQRLALMNSHVDLDQRSLREVQEALEGAKKRLADLKVERDRHVHWHQSRQEQVEPLGTDRKRKRT